MTAEKQEVHFISFVCPHCKQELEASSDMLGQNVECPACCMKIVVAPTPQISSPAQIEAMKSRTIRIELNDI